MIATHHLPRQYLGRSLLWTGWSLWIGFLCLYVAALVPIYAQGLQHLPATAFEYAGQAGYEWYGIPYGPAPEQVYGTDWAGLAVVGWIGPMLTFPVLVSLLWRLKSRWSSRKTREWWLLAGVCLITLVIFLVGWSIWEDFFIWGLG